MIDGFHIQHDLRQLFLVNFKNRLSSHALAMETGRYNKTDRIDRICYKCSHFVKDELHFILVRPSRIDYGRRFAKHYWEKPSMFKQF